MTSTKPKFSYLRRIMILPVISFAVILIAFKKDIHSNFPLKPMHFNSDTNSTGTDGALTNASSGDTVPDFKKKEENQIAIEDLKLDKAIFKKKYVIVIDPGHGGYDHGATGIDGTTEAVLDLEIAEALKQENKNEKLHLLFTRETDEYLSPVARANFTNESAADLYVSIHANEADENKINGIEIIIPDSAVVHFKTSYQFANSMANNLNQLDGNIKIKQRQVGVWVLHKAGRPAVLIETGYITNKNDLKKLKDKNYQHTLAKAILAGIERYLSSIDAQ